METCCLAILLISTETRTGLRRRPAVAPTRQSSFREQQMTAAHERLVLFLPRWFRKTRKVSINSKIVPPFRECQEMGREKNNSLCPHGPPRKPKKSVQDLLIDGCPREVRKGVLKPNESVICLPLKHGPSHAIGRRRATRGGCAVDHHRHCRHATGGPSHLFTGRSSRKKRFIVHDKGSGVRPFVSA